MQLKWEDAKVSKRKLTVELSAKPKAEWKESFHNTIRLLGDGGWGVVKLDGKRIEVADVPAGEEAKLHHYLKGLVEQADAAVAEKAQDKEEDPRAGGAEEPDAEMQERFRSFAADEEDAKPD